MLVVCSAHKVRPADIKVVAALGDSLTVRQETRAILLPLMHKLREF